MLKCSDCAASMRAMRSEGVTVDRCDACGGIWFDDAEIGRFRDSLEGRDQGGAAMRPPASAAAATVEKPRCPRCAVPLRLGEYAYGTGVRVGRCESCDGVWLPGAQVLRFIEHLRTAKAKREETREVVEEFTSATRAQLAAERALKDYSRRSHHSAYGGHEDTVLDFLDYFPLHAQTEGKGVPFVTVTLIIASAVTVWFFPQSLVNTLSFVPSRLSEGKGFTSLFASGVIYESDVRFWIDAFFFFVFGRAVETRVGSLRFLALCFGAHAVGAIVTAAIGGGGWMYAGGAASVAASMATYLTIYPKGRIQLTEAEEPLTMPALVLAAAFALLYWYLGPQGAQWWSVPAGLVVGTLLGTLWSRREE